MSYPENARAAQLLQRRSSSHGEAVRVACSRAKDPGSGGRRRLAREADQRLQLVRRVECRDLVGLGERRVVEDGADERVDGALVRHYCLADVDELGGARTEDVDAEEAPVLGRHEQLEDAVGVAGDLAAR